MNRRFVLLTLLIVVFSFSTACGNKKNEESNNNYINVEQKVTEVSENTDEFDGEKIKTLIYKFIDLENNEEAVSAKQLYTSWDDELNEIWVELKNTLSEEEYGPLLEKQRKWVEEKEACMLAFSDEYSCYITAAAMTRERCYELADIYSRTLWSGL